MYSSLCYLLDKDNSQIGKKFKKTVSKLTNFVPLTNGAYRSSSELHNRAKRPTLDDKVFDYICHNTPESGKIIPGAWYYFFEMENEYYLFPSELVIKNKEISFSELKPWKYPLPKISSNQQVNTKIPTRVLS